MRLLLQLNLFHLLGQLVLEYFRRLPKRKLLLTKHKENQLLSNHHQEVLLVEQLVVRQGFHMNQELLLKFQRSL